MFKSTTSFPLGSVLLLSLSALFFTPAPLLAQDSSLLDEISIKDNRIRRIDPESAEPLWEITHLSLPSSDLDSNLGTSGEFAGPVLWEDRLYYGLFNWLIRLNPDLGVIESRQLFPAPIVEISAGKAGLDVQVELSGESRQLALHYRPGPKAAEEIWSTTGLASLYHDASLATPGAFAIPNPVYADEYPTEEERRGQLKWLQEQAPKDPTNPFYLFFQAKLLIDLDKPEQAEELFDEMLNSPHLHWTSAIQLVALLDRIGLHTRAEQALERALDAFEEDEALASFQKFDEAADLLFFHYLDDALSDRIYRNDIESVDAIHDHIVRLFPHLQRSPAAWQALARWFDDLEHPDLAEKWSDKAKTYSPTPYGEFLDAQYRQAQLGYFLFYSLLIAGFLSAFIVGIRRSNRPCKFRWLPRPTAPEIVAILLTILVAVPLSAALIAGSLENFYLLDDAPASLKYEGWSSPDTKEWIQALHPSPARDQLLQQIEDLSKATYAGELAAYSGSVPNQALLVQALRSNSRTNFKESLVTIYFTKQTPPDFDWKLSGLLIALVALLLCLFVGHLFGTFLPRFYSFIRYIIPGAARSATFTTPLIIAATAAFITSMTMATQSPFYDYIYKQESLRFGHPWIYEQFHHQSTPTWSYLLLVSALAAHVFTLLLDHRRSLEK